MRASSRYLQTCVSAAVALLLLDVGATTKLPGSSGVSIRTLSDGIAIPADARSDCSLKSAAFKDWFRARKISLDGAVGPADAVTFPKDTESNCPFYEWAHRMFLWATSKTSPGSANGDRLFNSSTFFDVSTPDAKGERTLIAHVPGKPRFFPVRGAQADANGLQVLTSASGEKLEVQPAQHGAHNGLLVLGAAGSPVEVGRATTGSSGKPVFYDLNGRMIAGAKPLFPTLAARQAGDIVPVQKIIVGGRPVFVDGSGNAVTVAQGQADNSVLRMQNGSFVYYAIMVNDVYAYFLTGQKNKTFLATQFPTTQSDLDDITKLAAKHKVKLADPNALAIELKTSWVEASDLANPSQYIITTATVPVYDHSNPGKWTPNGTKTSTLALVGMHVVGSVAGNPEMIWSTFEHIDNAPNDTYAYTSASGTKTVDEDTRGTWLFCCSNHAGPFDQAHMRQSGADIVPIPPFTISPSDTLRRKAWGSASDETPNPFTSSVAASNAEVISLDSALLRLLPSGDARRNYFMLGATWTKNGSAPNGFFPTGNAVGTNRLDNATLETYLQGPSTKAAGTFSCFSCHSAAAIDLTGMSHVFPDIKPLWGKSLSAGTPTARTFKPSHTQTLVSWTSPATIVCQGQVESLGLPGSAFFQKLDSLISPRWTSFFPFLTSQPQTSASVGIDGAYAGNESTLLAVSYVGPWDQPDCSGDLTNGSNPPPYAGVTINAQTGVAFNLGALSHHAIYSASLVLNPVSTLRVLPPPGGGSALPTPVPPPPAPTNQPYGYRKIVHRKTSKPVVRLRKAPGAKPIVTTTGIETGARRDDRRAMKARHGKKSHAVWCGFFIGPANRRWWATSPLVLTYDKTLRKVLLKEAASVDVTSIVSKWVSSKGARDDGFVITGTLPPGFATTTSACVTHFEPVLKVVYF